MKSTIFQNRPGDLERISNYRLKFSTLSNLEIINRYNNQEISGVYLQTLYIIALHHDFITRFGRSPITFDGMLVTLGCKIKQVKNSWDYI